MKRTIKDFIFEKSLLFLALLTLAGLAGIVWFLFKEGMPVLETISLKHFLTGHDCMYARAIFSTACFSMRET